MGIAQQPEGAIVGATAYSGWESTVMVPRCLSWLNLNTSGFSGDLTNKPLAIILEPSRELAEQTREQARLFRKHLTSPTIRARAYAALCHVYLFVSSSVQGPAFLPSIHTLS